MKKLLAVLFIMLTIISIPLTACQKQTLLPYVTELKSDVLEGEENCPLKAYVIHREEPHVADGKVGEKQEFLKFVLTTDDINSNYQVYFSHDGKEYCPSFKLNNFSGKLTAETPIQNFDQKQITVILKKGAEQTEIYLKSIIPPNTISIENALNNLEKEQSALINSYKNADGQFCAEIIARVLMKNDKPYWYIGIVSEKDKKALLVDGLSGEILAIRDIFGD